MGSDIETWWVLIGRNSLSDLNPSSVLLMDFFGSHSLSITKTNIRASISACGIRTCYAR